MHSGAIEIRNGRAQMVDGAGEVSVLLHDEGFGGGALRLNGWRNRIESAHLRKALRKLSARRGEVMGDGEILRPDAGELPQDIRIIEAMPDRLRLDRDVGSGSKIADVDVASRHVDQEPRRQEGLVATPSRQKLARSIETLPLRIGG